MKPILGHGPHAVAICEALGIDTKTCQSIEFRMVVNEVVTIKVERLLFDDKAKSFAKVMELFNLVPENDWPQDISVMADTVKRFASAA